MLGRNVGPVAAADPDSYSVTFDTNCAPPTWLSPTSSRWGSRTDGFADQHAAIIADIVSNPTDALEVGTGLIDQPYVLVPDDDGVFQVARRLSH